MAKFKILKQLTLKPIASSTMRVSADYFNPVTIPAGTIVEGSVKTVGAPCTTQACIEGWIKTLSFTYDGKNFSTAEGTYALIKTTPDNTGWVTKYYNATVNAAKYGYKVGDAIKVGIKYNPMIQQPIGAGETYATYNGVTINDKELWVRNGSVYPAITEIILGTEISAADITPSPMPEPSPAFEIKSLFTPKNALIAVLGVLAIFGIVQLFKGKVKKE